MNQYQYKYNKKNYLKSKKPKIMLFKADWCRYCQEFKDTWNKLQHSDKINKDVIFKTYDSDKQKKLFNEYNIETFPTLLLEKNGEIKKYQGDRNLNDLIKFILSS